MAGEIAVTRFEAWQAARLQAQAAMTRALCHDLRGMLAPGLLVAERLQAIGDPALRVAGDRVAAMVTRATERLRVDHDAAWELVGRPLETIALQCLSLPPLEGGMVRADRAGVAVALAELAANSAAAGARRVEILPRLSATHVIILVRDDGPGLSEAARQTLFAPPSGPGSPIGLALARALLRAMGGDLQVVEGDLGASFEVSLRRA